MYFRICRCIASRCREEKVDDAESIIASLDGSRLPKKKLCYGDLQDGANAQTGTSALCVAKRRAVSNDSSRQSCLP